MTERGKQILEYTILEYVETAQPVSSFQLKNKYNIQYSGATIRNELSELERSGYLEQPHTSAGRIPTDQGYRYYVNHLIGRQEILKKYARTAYTLFEDLHMFEEMHVKLQHMLINLASASGNMAFAKVDNEFILEEGMSGLLRQPHFANLEFIQSALKDLDTIKEHIDLIGAHLQDQSYKVFIGKENPIDGLQNYTVIVGKFSLQQDNGTIVLVGPKGMQYEKNIALIEHMLNNQDNE